MQTVKRTNVYLDAEQARLVRHLAIEQGRSFTDLVREALNEYLVRRGLPTTSRVVGPRQVLSEEEWRSRFDAVLRRIRASVPADMSGDAIEREVTAAREEVRRERAAKRQAVRG